MVTLDVAGPQILTASLEETTGELALEVAERFTVPGRIAFCSDRGGGLDLWMLEGDNLVQLTHNQQTGTPMWHLAAFSWSPDGSQLAYKTYVNEVHEIHVLDVDSGTDTKITHPDGLESLRSTWSPDGLRLAFSGHDGNDWELYVTDWNPVTLEQGEVVRLTTNGYGDDAPDWSPVQNQIAWVSDGSIATIDPGDLDTWEDLTGPGYSWPQWSPDGSMIALWRGEFGMEWWQPFVMNADGSNLRPLTDGSYYFPRVLHPGHNPLHQWSPDGEVIAITDHMGDIYGENSEVLLVPVNGDPLVQFTESPFNDRWGYFSPDGSWIVFGSDRDGVWSLLVKNVATGEVITLTDGAGKDHGPIWVDYTSPPSG
jgi:Tol biopolymer transport system component